MTRRELTREIAKRIKDIRDLYYSVYPEGNYLDICIKSGMFHSITNIGMAKQMKTIQLIIGKVKKS